MEGVRVTLEEAKEWAEVSSYGYGYGYGYGYNGYGCGSGGNINGYDSHCCGYGDGYNFHVYGNGEGEGEGECSYGYGHGGCIDNDYNGHGGYGYNDYNGNGYGYGEGNGGHYSKINIQQINGLPVVSVDDVLTAIEVIHGDYAKAYTIRHNVILVPCYVARVGSSFAHGETLKEAFADAQSKEYSRMSEEKRIGLFIAQYPSAYEVVSNRELFAIHNALTGSCRFGREEFCKAHDINLDGSMTIASFLELTKNAYGGEIIKKIIKKYEEKN